MPCLALYNTNAWKETGGFVLCLSVNLRLLISHNCICHRWQRQMLIPFNNNSWCVAHFPRGVTMRGLSTRNEWTIEWMNEWIACPHCCWGLWGRPSSGGGGRPARSGPASRTGGLWWSHTSPGSSRISRTSSRRWSASGQRRVKTRWTHCQI